MLTGEKLCLQGKTPWIFAALAGGQAFPTQRVMRQFQQHVILQWNSPTLLFNKIWTSCEPILFCSHQLEHDEKQTLYAAKKIHGGICVWSIWYISIYIILALNNRFMGVDSNKTNRGQENWTCQQSLETQMHHSNKFHVYCCQPDIHYNLYQKWDAVLFCYPQGVNERINVFDVLHVVASSLSLLVAVV